MLRRRNLELLTPLLLTHVLEILRRRFEDPQTSPLALRRQSFPISLVPEGALVIWNVPWSYLHR
jgi:hypothetical protein